MRYKINYGFDCATLYTPSAEWEARFQALAAQCFGIRKSIMWAILVEQSEDPPTDKREGEYERLEYSGDTAIWNEKGEKIKNEWDE